MPFIHENFLLQTPAARRLFHEFAEGEPILDYHNHLSPRDIAQNRQFNDLGQLWLEDDHYKWRAMRADGVDERFCTGDASPYEKFLAWAKVVPNTLRNPLFHWTHHEYFRRVLCNLLGDDMTSGALPDDFEMVGTMTQRICYNNTRDFLGLEVN